MPGSSRKLRVGIIGLGRWGTNYLRTLTQLAGCRLIAGADLSPERRVACPVPTCATPEELLRHVGVDAVVIATPDRTHFSLARKALLEGKHVLVEKPMAMTGRDAEELADLAREKGLVLAVGHIMLYHPGFAALRHQVESGELGAVARVTAVRTSSGSRHATGVLHDLVPHDLAMIIAMFGPPLAVRATPRASGLSYRLIYPMDMLVSGWAGWQNPPHARRLRITGERSSALFIDAARADRDSVPMAETPLGRQCTDFIRCCLAGDEPRSSAGLGVEVCRVLGALAEAQTRTENPAGVPGLVA